MFFYTSYEIKCFTANKKVKQSVTGLEWPRGFKEVKVPRFSDNGTEWWPGC
jgi:hypothetical protein